MDFDEYNTDDFELSQTKSDKSYGHYLTGYNTEDLQLSETPSEN